MTYPKLDAIAGIHVFLTDVDIENGVPLDCMRCAVAQAIRRMMGDPDAIVEIYPTRAYVVMPVDARTIKANLAQGNVRAKGVKPGDLVSLRFEVDGVLSKQVLNFDGTQTADPLGYHFRALRPSQRLGSKSHGKADGSRPELSRKRSPWLRARGPMAQGRPVEVPLNGDQCTLTPSA